MEFSLGLIEVSALGNAIIMLDDMLKAADVEFVATERKLGGRLVTIVVRGELTSVQASVDAGVQSAQRNGCLKAYQVIARPHEEILKFLHLDNKDKEPNSEIAGTHVGEVGGKDDAQIEEPAKKAPARRRGRPKRESSK